MTSAERGENGERGGSELRRDFLSGRWVLIAPERARRPNDFQSVRAPTIDVSRTSCPFCEGREAETPPEVEALRDESPVPDSAGWRVRVVPNKFPALTPGPEPTPEKRAGGLFESLPGTGVHEVVVDTPDHDREWVDLPVDHIRDVLGIFRRRLRAIEQDSTIQYVQIFKNKGGFAGASLRHPHTQILGVPVVPQQVWEELSALEHHARESGGCFFCRLIKDEEAGPRRIRTGPDFIALAPYASRFPYETHVLPRRHTALFRETTDEELIGLARMMKFVLSRLRDVASDPDYHIVLRQAPVTRGARPGDPRLDSFVHWRIEVLPVMGLVAGFEWGTGCFINPIVPESAAAALRG
ncbi:MAG: DUF4931 domain-containing protein [Candidatus Aminicenantes bacterium]|nr:DUF4931 domain-containing protein [Candidatus Aminicenantes bacterium]